MEKSILDVETIEFDGNKRELRIIDQTRLPLETVVLRLKTQEEIWNAIRLLQVRGAPAIGVAAAYGVYMAAEEINAAGYDDFLAEYRKAQQYLASSRPTAVNLFWALERMESVVLSHAGQPLAAIRSLLRREADAIRTEDAEVCRRIGEYGLTLLDKNDGILTHCNAGKLATVQYGTATAPIYLGQQRGYNFRVFADETRPLLQGARLTAYELQSAGVDVTLICDNMSASVMKRGWVQAVLVGCDRVAANGDTANKIGTSVVAAVARQYHVPFYVCAPTSTIDLRTACGDDIVIEERAGEEITEMWYAHRMAPAGVKTYNPAFDVTDHALISGIITEYGIAREPYTESLAQILQKKAAGGSLAE